MCHVTEVPASEAEVLRQYEVTRALWDKACEAVGKHFEPFIQERIDAKDYYGAMEIVRKRIPECSARHLAWRKVNEAFGY